LFTTVGRLNRPLLRGVRRTCTHLAALALDAVEQSRLFAAHIRTGGHDHLEAVVETAAFDVVADPALRFDVRHRLLHDLHRLGVLGADVQHACIGTHAVAGDHHAQQHQVRTLLQQVTVAEGSGIALVGVAHDVLARAGVQAHVLCITAGLQLEAHGEAGTTAPTDRRDLDLVKDVHGIAFQDAFPKCVMVRQLMRHRCGEDRPLHGGADVVGIHVLVFHYVDPMGRRYWYAGRTLRDVIQPIDRITAVIPSPHVERAVLMAAPEAAHVADLLGLEVLAQFVVHLVLRAGHQTGAAVAHVGFHALVLAPQEVVEAAGAVGHGLPDEEVVGHFGQGFRVG
jgi:hypothetical protein